MRNPISPNHLVNEEIGELVNEDEELTNLVDEEGSEAKNGLLLDDRANLLQAGHLQLPGQIMSSLMAVAPWDGIGSPSGAV